MKRNKFIILFSYLLFFMMFGVLFADLGGAFSFSDIPFFIVFGLFVIFMFIQQGKSKVSFLIALYLLMAMGLSYIKTGPGIITERLGEWFYLFFLGGLLYSIRELWSKKI